ncbi:hypothetical protein CF335_g1841, partial [Tilletia laevis]
MTSPSNGTFKRRKIDWKGKGKAVDGGESGGDDVALPPVIVALDVDCFYAQASRLRDPSLIGIPLGVQQKTILAAVSYEARAQGVPKIVSMREALRILPSLTIVNGEDLSFFRLLSNRSWRLLRSLVWDERVEKCGMDELWADVTETVDDHLLRCQLDRVNRDKALGIFFSFDQLPLEHMQPVDLARGFWYRPSDPIPGYFQPDPHSFTQGWPQDPWRQRYALGAHITSFFRRIIREQVNLDCSGGVSFSKQMAKLIRSANKPNKQTCFCPAQPLEGVNVTRNDFHRRFLQDAQDYIDPLDLGKLNGFGHVYVKKLEEIQQGQQSGFSNATTNTTREETHSHNDWLNGHHDSVKAKHRLTVSTARHLFTAAQFNSLFGSTIGPRLWSILHATDTEPVAIASDLAVQQISIEDTYRNLPPGPAAVAEMRKLGESLIKRLEVECVEMPDEAWVAAVRGATRQRAVLETVVVGPSEEHGPGVEKEERMLTQVRNYVDVEEEDEQQTEEVGRAIGSEMPASTTASNKQPSARRPKSWRRYPLSVRLSLRIGWGARFSKTGKMPIGIFDLTQPRKKRVEILLSTVVNLFRQMTASRDISEGFNLINIAALELSKSPPASHDIKNLLEKASSMAGGGGGGAGAMNWIPQVQDEIGHAAAVGMNDSVYPQPGPQPEIDLDVLKDLPADIAAEIAQEYGIPWPLPTRPPLLPSQAEPELRSSPSSLVEPERSSFPPDARPRTPSTPPFPSRSLSPLPRSPSLSPSSSCLSFPPSQLSAQSFSPPPQPRSMPTTSSPSPPPAEEPPAPIEPHEDVQVDQKQEDVDEVTQHAPSSQPGAGSETSRLSRRFGHFELSGCEMSIDELERLLAPPTPPLLPSPSPSPSPPDKDDDAVTTLPLPSTGPPRDPLLPPSPDETEQHRSVEVQGAAPQGSSVEVQGAAPQGSTEPVSTQEQQEQDKGTMDVDWEQEACRHCGRQMVIWLQHDHDVFGESGLPAGQQQSSSSSSSSTAAVGDGHPADAEEVMRTYSFHDDPATAAAASSARRRGRRYASQDTGTSMLAASERQQLGQHHQHQQHTACQRWSTSTTNSTNRRRSARTLRPSSSSSHRTASRRRPISHPLQGALLCAHEPEPSLTSLTASLTSNPSSKSMPVPTSTLSKPAGDSAGSSAGNNPAAVAGLSSPPSNINSNIWLAAGEGDLDSVRYLL